MSLMSKYGNGFQCFWQMQQMIETKITYRRFKIMIKLNTKTQRTFLQQEWYLEQRVLKCFQ